MSDEFQVDYDAEAVWLDDAWYGREDLARRIKQMIESGDYRIARPSSALEKLEAAMGVARVLAVRVPPELADAAESLAARAGRPASAILRDALVFYVGAQGGLDGARAEDDATPAGGMQVEELSVSEEQVVVVGDVNAEDRAWFGTK
jgi:hypothetical protein